MGNVPTKEAGRSRSSTYTSGSDSTGFITRGAIYGGSNVGLGGSGGRRNTTSATFGALSLSEFKRTKRTEESNKIREAHYLNLLVKYQENVDGGYLAPHGTYKLNLDFNTEIVRKMIIQRQLAPFYTPMQDFDDSWLDSELVILVLQVPLHLIDLAYLGEEEEEDDVDNHKIHKSSNFYKRQDQKLRLKELVAKIKELQKVEENNYLEAKMNHNVEVALNELRLQLYRDAIECPICFLYYPNHLNVSRCCVQPICTECFVQIKRLEPHPLHENPEDKDKKKEEDPNLLISEPANCPYCALPDFGVTYDLPRGISTGIGGICKPGEFGVKRRDSEESTISLGLDGISGSSSGISSPNSVAFAPGVDFSTSPVKPGVRRKSLAANSTGVISIDAIRPDWEVKLIAARSKVARKAAAASAIHASNLIIPGEEEPRTGGSSNGLRSFEDRMVEEAMRLSILDEDERQRKAEEEEEKERKNKLKKERVK